MMNLVSLTYNNIASKPHSEARLIWTNDGNDLASYEIMKT